MARLAEALEALARRHGAAFRYGAEVREILVTGGRTRGIRLADGETVEAAAVVLNADPAALGAGRFGAAVAGAVERTPVDRRSFSAITWAMRATVEGTAPAAQTVVHADDPTVEYAELGYRARLPAAPTVTLWAQDRMAGAVPPPGPERLLMMVNAPARADLRPEDSAAIARCGEAAFARLARAGLPLQRGAEVVTTPADFDRLFPGNGGALYGPAVHGWQAAFSRPGARTKLPGLFLAGGGTHPGAGVAMAALSGRSAALQVIEASG
jgi:1-hydroxycarotenoid 3,4-desaturase